MSNFRAIIKYKYSVLHIIKLQKTRRFQCTISLTNKMKKKQTL